MAAAAAAPQDYYQQQPEIRLLSYRFNADDKGNYEYGYEQDNGQKVRNPVSFVKGARWHPSLRISDLRLNLYSACLVIRGATVSDFR